MFECFVNLFSFLYLLLSRCSKCLSFICSILLCIRGDPLLSADASLQLKSSASMAKFQPPKDIASFSSSTSSPWDSPEEPPHAPKPAPARARSAPITLPTDDPIKSPEAHSPPKSSDAFSSVSWSQSQWIAFNDSFAPVRHQSSGPSMKETPHPIPGSGGRSSRFLSEEATEAHSRALAGRDDCFTCFSDVFCGVSDKPAASANIAFNGNLASCGRKL